MEQLVAVLALAVAGTAAFVGMRYYRSSRAANALATSSPSARRALALVVLAVVVIGLWVSLKTGQHGRIRSVHVALPGKTSAEDSDHDDSALDERTPSYSNSNSGSVIGTDSETAYQEPADAVFPSSDSDSDSARTGGQDSARDGEAAPEAQAVEQVANCTGISRRGDTIAGVSPRVPVPVQYIHLPKAGGTTVQNALRDWGKQANLRVITQDLGPVNLCPQRVATSGGVGMVLLGHRGFGYCPRVRKKLDPLYVVSIREPVSRLVSMYDYAMITNRHSTRFSTFHNQWGADASFDALVRRLNHTDRSVKARRMLEGIANQQVRFMCGFECHGANTSVPLDVAVDRALENLRKTHCVGVLEHLDDLLVQLKFHLPWIPRGKNHWGKDNARKTRKSRVSAESRAVLLQWGWGDALLYEAAREIARERTTVATACMPRTVKVG